MSIQLAVHGLSYAYTDDTVLDDISLTINPGEVVSFVGPNGTGKSTFLKCVDRILKIRHGTVYIGPRSIQQLSQTELAKHVGYVPQSQNSHFPITVYDAVMLGRRPYIAWRESKADRMIVEETLALLKLSDLASRDFSHLSGGQRQRVLIARALVQRPDVILLDEPTSNLDLKYQLDVMALVASLAQRKGLVVIDAIHDLNLAARYSHKTAFLREGRIHAWGKPKDVLTASNIKAVYDVDVTVKKEDGIVYVVPAMTVRGEEAL